MWFYVISCKRGLSLTCPVFRESRELFGPEKLVVNLQNAYFEKLIFLHVFNIRKIKRTAKFEGLEPRRCEDIKGIVAPERDPKSNGTFEKQAPDLNAYVARETARIIQIRLNHHNV